MRPIPCRLIALLLLVPSMAGAEDVIRHKLPVNSTFPIAAAVEVPAGATTVYLSGKVPPAIDDKAPRDSVAAYGDTERQTVGVLGAIRDQLKGLGLGMGDVVKMQVFLVGDPDKGGKMDFAGFMKGYTQFFGTAEQPNLPSRSAMQVAALANPGFLVEIEVTAVRP
ncbi:Enamine deaminase RidA, house cleaning of reactive enamine intermediates, YjgF/YER057c/UK114 family [Dokdonella immobilis]|uniref:Enamine deaminase RidA, house cleaning of reactive enamine intermediates, YjgF/YER057c/UK114 family n=2 Tax=Dokdonella immobilis TaxID=578942 RepID=A0A1I4WCT3_9GAMM|nr:RidA family protein [Dokdonella immobilis]SFN11468.1 Enamine deaminase RidA, house cleaning of reactive enamine intermediates, YjgF/YER057c/UK114 family [Dokdonella immobilis]